MLAAKNTTRQAVAIKLDESAEIPKISVVSVDDIARYWLVP